jgi:hypothetical protein
LALCLARIKAILISPRQHRTSVPHLARRGKKGQAASSAS